VIAAVVGDGVSFSGFPYWLTFARVCADADVNAVATKASDAIRETRIRYPLGGRGALNNMQ